MAMASSGAWRRRAECSWASCKACTAASPTPFECCGDEPVGGIDVLGATARPIGLILQPLHAGTLRPIAFRLLLPLLRQGLRIHVEFRRGQGVAKGVSFR